MDSVQKPDNKIKTVIGVLSGKGGVGKSTVSFLLAVYLKQLGYSVGVMDADITGPSMPRLFNITKAPALQGTEHAIEPYMTKRGIPLISMNFFLESEDKPVVWRGPLLGKAVQQLWEEVVWGELDYLIIDLPPGTADITLTTMQSIPLNGLVFVSTPHDLVSVIVRKTINMAAQLSIPMLGIVENMSYMKCPHCGEKIDVFPGASDHPGGLDLLLELPIAAPVAACNVTDIKAQFPDIDRDCETFARLVAEKAKK